MPNPTSLTLLALMPLIVWRMVSRVRRMIGRQRLSRIRPWLTLVVFPLVLCLIGVFAFPHWERLWWMAGGLALGAGAAVIGLKLTTFEPTPDGLFYTPNAHLGIAISLLFIGRVTWRLVEAFTLDAGAPQPAPDAFMRSPFTLVVIGIMGGYYITYATGLIRWRMGVMKAKRLREAQAPEPGVL